MTEPRADLPGAVTAHAVVRADGSAEVDLVGVVQVFAAESPDRVAGNITEYVAERAAADDRAVRLHLEDPDGRWVLVVHPDGAVEELSGPSVRGRRRRDEPAGGGHAGTRPQGGPSTAEAMVEQTPDPGEPRRRARVPVVRPPTGTIPLRDLDAAPGTGRDPRPAAAADGAPGTEPAATPLPTLDDLLATRPPAPSGPARLGWQGAVRRLTAGLVSPPPGAAEVAHRRAVESVQRSLGGPRTVVVVNPKGGAHKTTATLLLAATFGTHRGGYTLAWDNNETRGTLGWRSAHGRHANTAVDLLRDLDRFADPGSPRVGDLDSYVRSQGSAQFDVLASDEDAASAASVDAEAFRALHRTLARFYRVMVVDTGNNMRASNWQAAVAAADQLVIVSTVREDTAQSAAWAVDALRATGHDDAVRRAVTVLSAPSADVDEQLRSRLHDHFGRLNRVVLDVPHDASLVSGGPLLLDALAPATREAWLQVAAAVADGL